jgi:hypothetical protein
MADLSITAASVSLYSGEPLRDQVAGGAITTGDIVYKADNETWLRAQSDGTAVEAGANGLGIALATAAAAGARLSIASDGCIVTLGTGSAGVLYVPSATAGKLAPIADMITTSKVTPFALGIGSSQVQLRRNYNAGAVL